MKYTFENLEKAGKKTLENIMEEGFMPELAALIGWEFDGYNLTPLASILGIRKFRKGFYKEEGAVKGYNVKMKQNKFQDPWEYKSGKPERFGWFDILSAQGVAFMKGKRAQYKNALLLDYGTDKRNSLFQGKLLRDFLVQVNEVDKNIYLGKAYNEVKGKLLMPSYFILKRAEKVYI